MRNLLFIIACVVAITAKAQFESLEFMASASASSVPSYTAIASNTAAYDSSASFGSADNQLYCWWPLTNAVAATVHQLDLSLSRGAGFTNRTFSVGIYLTDDGTNALAQVGSDSDGIDTGTLSTSLTTNTIVWSAGFPSLEATNYMIVMKVSASVSGNSIQTGMHGAYTAGILRKSSTDWAISGVLNRRPYFVLRGTVL